VVFGECAVYQSKVSLLVYSYFLDSSSGAQVERRVLLDQPGVVPRKDVPFGGLSDVLLNLEVNSKN